MALDSGSQITAWSIFSLLIGTVVSSIVAYLLQRNSFAEVRRQQAQVKFDQRKAIGLTLFHKLIRIASTIELVKRNVTNSINIARTNHQNMQYWQMVMPIGNLPNPVRFSPEEITFLMLLDLDLFNEFGSFDEVHNGLIDILLAYRTRRVGMTDGLPASMSGNVGTTKLSQNEMEKIAPKMAELNSMVEQITKQTEYDSVRAWQALEKLRLALNKEFKLNLQLQPT